MKKHQIFFMPHPPILIQTIGEGKELAAENTLSAMNELAKMIEKERPETIIFISPHGNSFSNGTCILYEEMLTGHLGNFGHPEITFQKKVNTELSQEIYDKLEAKDITTILMDKVSKKQYNVKVNLDHGVLVPMSFIDTYYTNYSIVHITPGFTSFEEQYLIGKIIGDTIHAYDKKVLIVCSGDLSHALCDQGPYDYHPQGPVFDATVKNSIENKDPLSLIFLENSFVEEAAQCGLRSFIIGFGTMDGYYYSSNVNSYEGPFGVGYLTGYLCKTEEATSSLLPVIHDKKYNQYLQRTKKEDDYILLARKSIENYVKTGKRLSLDYVKSNFVGSFFDHCLSKKSGAFVSIHKFGKLRGCIGTISASSEHLIDEIIYNSISACSKDPRFDAIKEDELLDLEVKVDILYEKEAIHSRDMLDVHRYGVIVEKGGKRGLLLPNLEGIDEVDEQVHIAMQKAGIESEEGIKLYRFEVERHEVK